MTPVVKPKALTVAGVAVAVGCSNDMIYRLIYSGVLPAVKVGSTWRIREEDVDALLASGSQPKQPAVDDLIAEIVATAPPLSDEQVDRIVAIIRADRGVA